MITSHGNMRTLKFKARQTNAFFATANQMFGSSSQVYCRVLFRLNCAQWFDNLALGSWKSRQTFDWQNSCRSRGGARVPPYWFPLTGSPLLVSPYWFPLTASPLLVPPSLGKKKKKWQKGEKPAGQVNQNRPPLAQGRLDPALKKVGVV